MSEKNRLNKTAYKVEYPYNKAMITESGHEVHYDDSPGNERIRISHKDGTYDEISVGGKRVSYTVGQNQQYNKSGVTITVDHNYDIKISGHQRVLVGGGSHVEIAGDAAVVVGGDMSSVVAGNQQTAVAGDIYVASAGDMNMNVGGNMSMDVSGSMNMKVAGTTTMETGGDHSVNAANIKLNS